MSDCVFPLCADEALESMSEAGCSRSRRLGSASRSSPPLLVTPYEDDEIECPIVFDDVDAAKRAFMGARADAARDQQLR